MSEHLLEASASLALKDAWQKVEQGRPNVLGALEGADGGRRGRQSG